MMENQFSPSIDQQQNLPSFNRELYPGYDEYGRRRGFDHLYGRPAPPDGTYYRPNALEYGALTEAQPQQEHFEYGSTAVSEHYDHSPDAGYSVDPTLPSQPTNPYSRIEPPRRVKTLHQLFGLDIGVPISLQGLRDPPPGQKPEYTYPTLMKVAIWSSPRKALTLQEIYEALENRFPWFKTCENPNSWKTSIRHSLSLIAIFQKKARPPTDPGKGSYWTLDLTKGEGNKRARKRNKKSSQKMALAETPAHANAIQHHQQHLEEEEISQSESDECIDPALIHQPHQPSEAVPQGVNVSSKYTSSHAAGTVRHGPRPRDRRTSPYPANPTDIQYGHNRRPRDVHSAHESENDSLSAGTGGRSASSTPFEGESSAVLKPVLRQLPAVPGYYPGPMPASLNQFHLAYGISSDHSINTGSSSNQPQNGAPPRLPPPSNFAKGGARQGVHPSSTLPKNVAKSAANTTAVPAAGAGGFAAHASAGNLSFAAASGATRSSETQLAFGRRRDDIEIVQVGGLPVARRVSNARATSRGGQ